MELMQETESEMQMDYVISLTEQINEVIVRELVPRLSAFSTEVELQEVNDDGTVSLMIKENKGSLFFIRREILENIVVSKIKYSISGIRKVIVTWH
ncbi:MAG: hypothetical protein HPY50_13650 [Firmicutes bacterium]|nr:hypothetical protein [Bacillota bacterium]